MSATRRILVAVLLVGLVFLLAFVAVRLRLVLPTITLTVSALFVTFGWLLAPLALRLQHPLALVAALIGLVVLFLPLLWMIGGPSSHVVNTWRLSVFQQQFLSSPPPGVAAQLVRSEVGVLTGNGNHCDYVVSVSFDGPAEPTAALAHYKSLPVQHAIPGSTTGIHVFQRSGEPLVVTITDAPNEPAFDVRCH